MSQCSGSIEDIKRVSLILDDDEEQPEEFGLTGLNASDKQSGKIPMQRKLFIKRVHCKGGLKSDSCQKIAKTHRKKPGAAFVMNASG